MIRWRQIIENWFLVAGLFISFSLSGTALTMVGDRSEKSKTSQTKVVEVSSIIKDIDSLQLSDNIKPPNYSEGGADTCLLCHNKDSKFPVLSLFKTAHGSQKAKNGPFSPRALQCEACHGPVGEHSKIRLKKGEIREPMISFGSKDRITMTKKNEICLECHQKNDLGHWNGSSHQINDTGCVDCHKIHARQDPIQIKSAQVSECGKCHIAQKLAMNRVSTHPLRYGQMGCTDCHRSHDSEAETLLIGETINETCYQCHAEKRGPFLWEHEPVTDSCVNCHLPHGSNHSAMLTQRAPFLCQNCHSSEGHANFSVGSESLLPANPSAIVLGRSCVNCHSQTHGSNHPSGARFKR